MIQKEEWKDIKGYEGLYQVSNLGEVKRFYKTREEKIIKPFKDKYGYLVVNLYREGKSKTIKVHRLVANAFLENYDNLPCINHKDENKQNNNVKNLEFCTCAYNNTYGSRLEKIRKKVLQFDKQGNLIQEWDSISRVNKAFKIKGSSISEVCKGKRKSCKGYIWKYAS